MTSSMQFVDSGGRPPEPQSVLLEPEVVATAVSTAAKSYPDPIITISDEKRDKFLIWLDEWLMELIGDQSPLQDDWAKIEEAYRAAPGSLPEISSPPFKGACMDIIPVIAMAVDPIHARLDTGIFKQDPVFNVKALRRNMTSLTPSLSAFIDAYQKHVLKLRSIASPRMLECTKLGTMVFKTVFDHDVSQVVTYDETFQVVKREDVKFKGPRVFGISLGDFLFPPTYQHLQDCPIVVERQRTMIEKLHVVEYSKKITNVDKIEGQERGNWRTPLESARDAAAGHKPSTVIREIVVYEAWCDYDIDGDGQPEHLVATYHYETRTLLQLRYNWYFHQKKPYTVIPYSICNDTLLGRGIGAMTLPFELAITRFHRMASDNAYIANIRMFIARKGSGIEDVPRLYSGKVFFVEDPTKDFIPFAGGDIYPSTLSERSNLFGMVEKLTGVSDYMSGRESPIVGTRATATGTLAIIEEGTRRVEEVLENVRVGFADIIEYCLSIWIQYGTGGVEDKFFEGDQIALDVKQFFALASHENVNGLVGVELAATDATTGKVAQQQMQLALIQIMMQYLEKVLQAGQGALAAAQTQPQLVGMITEVMGAARRMFSDLLKKYDVRNAEDYLPDLEKYLNGPNGALNTGLSAGPGSNGGPGAVEGESGMAVGTGPARAPAQPRPATPGSGGLNRVVETLSRSGAS